MAWARHGVCGLVFSQQRLFAAARFRTSATPFTSKVFLKAVQMVEDCSPSEFGGAS
jgi:hypothetical protein